MNCRRRAKKRNGAGHKTAVEELLLVVVSVLRPLSITSLLRRIFSVVLRGKVCIFEDVLMWE